MQNALPNTELPENVRNMAAPKTMVDLAKAVRQMIGLAQNDGTIQLPERGDDGLQGPIGPEGPEGPSGADGIISRAAPWTPDRYYGQNSVCTHLAGLWQSQTPGDAEPGTTPQWTCLSRGVVDAQLDDAHQLILRYSDQTTQVLGDVQGPRGRNWEAKGTYQPAGWYTRDDVVIVRGTSYVAVDDSPGECPGPGWQMVAQAKAGPSGKRGPEGARGDRGDRGDRGAPGVTWKGQHVAGWSYAPGDLVRLSNSVFICMEETHEQPSADSLAWDLFVSAPG